ncbi:unnamed protein product [Arctia plantaginis]|uniref:Uncharacterized protein n=1 Tax=Arctia plantaginis TaxID=874455 RepID=A0A8S1BQK9_ARCPL|nr:unnamed protein product [Arctia plantaginis]
MREACERSGWWVSRCPVAPAVRRLSVRRALAALGPRGCCMRRSRRLSVLVARDTTAEACACACAHTDGSTLAP